MNSKRDEHYMRHALSMAARVVGHVAPNPAVGCVLVKAGSVLAAAHTARSGRPHAETQALDVAGERAQGATAYVTLEPCSHTGKTGPCAEALINAGVARVVIACTDPDPRVSGQGIEMLKEAGIAVDQGVCEEAALRLNAGFILRVTQNRPYVTLKCAISADGKIAEAVGKRTQISGSEASRYMHHLRSFYDAILVGRVTEFVDQPKLTTRIQGYEHISEKIVLDAGVGQTTKALAGKGITRLLVEGGAKTHTSFLKTGLYDEVQLIRSPKVLGDQGVDAADFGAIEGLKLQKTRALGEDVLEIYRLEH